MSRLFLEVLMWLSNNESQGRLFISFSTANLLICCEKLLEALVENAFSSFGCLTDAAETWKVRSEHGRMCFWLHRATKMQLWISFIPLFQRRSRACVLESTGSRDQLMTDSSLLVVGLWRKPGDRSVVCSRVPVLSEGTPPLLKLGCWTV